MASPGLVEQSLEPLDRTVSSALSIHNPDCGASASRADHINTESGETSAPPKAMSYIVATPVPPAASAPGEPSAGAYGLSREELSTKLDLIVAMLSQMSTGAGVGESAILPSASQKLEVNPVDPHHVGLSNPHNGKGQVENGHCTHTGDNAEVEQDASSKVPS